MQCENQTALSIWAFRPRSTYRIEIDIQNQLNTEIISVLILSATALVNDK